MQDETIERLAYKIVEYFKAKGLKIEEIRTELEAAIEVIMSGEEVNLTYLNMRLKEQNERFEEFDEDAFAEILAFIYLSTGVQFEFSELH
ncbi:MAG: hypothetical protein Q7T50_06125 [Candidatus Magasanikbacteria bacterium]|nr:hypothetical protein [Candidatus Magasanikbacteria bacterium]